MAGDTLPPDPFAAVPKRPTVFGIDEDNDRHDLLIYTFYSFKGGVGRSMALANIAELLYRRGLNILLVDFDLEAPGLERYFDTPEAIHNPAEIMSRRGVIDMLLSYKELRSLELQKSDDADTAIPIIGGKPFPYPVEPITNFVVPIYAQSGNRGTLSIIPAGRRIGDDFARYAGQVRSFNWDEFYLKFDGEQFFEWFRSAAGVVTDVVLIDSRTGVTEMSGVCTYQLADAVVMFAAPNQQNLEGTQMMAQSLSNPELVEVGRHGRPLSLLFVPSRVEHGEAGLLDSFAKQFDTFLNKYAPPHLRFEKSAFTDLKIPYVPYYAYMENVSVREASRASAADMIMAFERLAVTLAQIAPTNHPLYKLYHISQGGRITPSDYFGQRVINAWIADLPKDTPLKLGETYELRFNVDIPRDDGRLRIASGRGVSNIDKLLASNQELIEILVVLESGNFELYGSDSQLIIMQWVGKSKNAAVFTIEPKEEGIGELNAIFYVNGSLFQRVKIKLPVGDSLPAAPSWSADIIGLTIASALAQPLQSKFQEVNIMIIAKEAGYQIIVQGGGVARAFLKISAEEIAGWIKRARNILQSIIHMQDVDGNYPYQDADTTIAPEIHANTLRKLAKGGIDLFEDLFYGNSGPDARAMGDLLKSLSEKRQLQVRIVAERFFFPWSFLYDGDDPDNPDPKQFWGFKHIIEYMPEFSVTTTVNFTPTIEVGGTLDMAFVCNNNIDTQFGQPIVQGQRDAFNALPGVNVKDYANTQDLINLMKDPSAPPLIYFYCPAVSKFPDEEGGVDDSKITLTDTNIALRELKIKARTRLPVLANAPLVFLNICESAELSPYLYDGLMPYMIARGVRGMIGTEIEAPALFAAEFGKDFIRRFTAGGQPLGDLLLDMRREYLEQKNNILGLVYALYSNGDVVVQRPA